MPRRVAILVLIAIVLGAITTVAVAWGVAVKHPADAGVMFDVELDSDYIEVDGGTGLVSIAASTGKSVVSVLVFRELEGASFLRTDHEGLPIAPLSPKSIPHWFVQATLPTRTIVIPPAQGGATSCTEYFVCAFGWPDLALRGTTLEVSGATEPFDRYQEAILVRQPDVALPLGIIWPGFLINTLSYAAAWFVLLFAAHRATRALITRRRLRRGTCPACRYNLLGDFSSGCPECGWNRAVTPPS